MINTDGVIRAGVCYRMCGRTSRLELVYDAADPYAVTLHIPIGNGVIKSWTLGRELLNDGLVGHTDTATGDVRVAPTSSGALAIVLDSPDGHAELALNAAPVAEFLDAAYELVPAGTESRHIEWDRELAALRASVGGDRSW